MKQESKKALLYSVGYVGLSTVFLYSIYPSDPFAFEGLQNNIFYLILSLLAIPGQLFSWGIRYAGSESNEIELLLILTSQILNVLV